MKALLKWPPASTELKLSGLALLLVPIGLLFLFTVGEGRDGLQHLVQLAPLVALIVLAWYRSRLGGLLLAGIGLALAVVYPFYAHFPLGTTIATIAIFFGPAIVAGALFWFAGGKSQAPATTQQSSPVLRA
jgi:hypothetical protein